jgi:hypothetical protein
MTSRRAVLRRWLLPAHLLLAALAAYALLTPACATDGHFSILGYSTQPNYDLRFHSVFVPIFRNRTPWNLNTAPGMEMDLTRAVVNQIEQITPYKVLSCNADTELRGLIVSFTKTMLNYNQVNQIREAQTTMVCEIIWRDRRTGELLSRPARRPGQAGEPELRQPLLTPSGSLLPPGARPVAIPGTPQAATSGAVPAPGPGDVEEEIIDPLTRKKAVPVVIKSVAYFRPEIGESFTTAENQNIQAMAVQIVSAMEKGW